MKRSHLRYALVKTIPSNSWHLITCIACFIFAATTLLVFHGKFQPPTRKLLPPPINKKVPDVSVSPEGFSNSFFNKVDHTLTELGLLPKLIQKERGKIDIIRIRIPNNLPLAEANLAVTRLTNTLGGRVSRAVELERGSNITMHLVFNEIHTTTIIFEQSDQTHAVGSIAVIIDSVDNINPVIERFCNLPQPLTFFVTSKKQATLQYLAECGHATTSETSLTDSLRKKWEAIDQIDDFSTIEIQLWNLADQASRIGQIVAIARPRINTLLAIEAILPRLETRGHRVVLLKNLSP